MENGVFCLRHSLRRFFIVTKDLGYNKFLNYILNKYYIYIFVHYQCKFNFCLANIPSLSTGILLINNKLDISLKVLITPSHRERSSVDKILVY